MEDKDVGAKITRGHKEAEPSGLAKLMRLSRSRVDEQFSVESAKNSYLKAVLEVPGGVLCVKLSNPGKLEPIRVTSCCCHCMCICEENTMHCYTHYSIYYAAKILEI